MSLHWWCYICEGPPCHQSPSRWTSCKNQKTQWFAVGSTRHCMMMSSIALLESFKTKKLLKSHKIVNTEVMSAVSVLLLIDSLATRHQKAFTPAEKLQDKISYWATAKCRFIFQFFSRVSFRCHHKACFQSGTALLQLLLEEKGWDDPLEGRGTLCDLSGHFLALFGKCIKLLVIWSTLEA